MAHSLGRPHEMIQNIAVSFRPVSHGTPQNDNLGYCSSLFQKTRLCKNIIGMKILFYGREAKNPHKHIIISTESFDLYTVNYYSFKSSLNWTFFIWLWKNWHYRHCHEWKRTEVCNEALYFRVFFVFFFLFLGKQRRDEVISLVPEQQWTAKEEVPPQTTRGDKWQCDQFIL